MLTFMKFKVNTQENNLADFVPAFEKSAENRSTNQYPRPQSVRWGSLGIAFPALASASGPIVMR